MATFQFDPPRQYQGDVVPTWTPQEQSGIDAQMDNLPKYTTPANSTPADYSWVTAGYGNVPGNAPPNSSQYAYNPNTYQPTPHSSQLAQSSSQGQGGPDPTKPTTEAQFSQYLTDIQNAVSSVGEFIKKKVIPPAYANTYNPPTYAASNRQSSSVFTPTGGGQWGTGENNGPMVNGTMQTGGGGFTPEGSYSAGYHGGGGSHVDRGPYGNGPNMGPTINGTVQTGGGQFGVDYTGKPFYSAGYHGSGAHPEITGESLPGDYRSGSFGSIFSPELSNEAKVSNYLAYLKGIGYDVSQYEGMPVMKQMASNYAGSGQFNGMDFIRSLPQANQQKTELLSQVAANPMMPTAQALNILGGPNYANLGSNLPSTPGTTQYGSAPYEAQNAANYINQLTK